MVGSSFSLKGTLKSSEISYFLIKSLWRFNLRLSNTEPVIRLNVEVRGDKALLAAKTGELLAIIRG